MRIKVPEVQDHHASWLKKDHEDLNGKRVNVSNTYTRYTTITTRASYNDSHNQKRSGMSEKSETIANPALLMPPMI